MRESTRRNVEAARASSTRALYAAAWTAFVAWQARNEPEMELGVPAGAAQVADYLSELGERAQPATVRVHAAAIAARHRDAGLPSPTDTALVRDALAGHTNRRGLDQVQARALDAAAYLAITEVACTPRRTRGGRMETDREANRRGITDMAVIGLMRDAMLRRSEAAALTWRDLQVEPDGSGSVRIRRSKTDQAGAGATRYVSPEIVEVLEVLRTVREDGPDASITGLSPSQICRRIAAATAAAGLGPGYSGHSPRVGMAVDLARGGISMPMILNAGRWSSERTAMRYVEAVTANRGAVAAWYAQQEDDDDGTQH